MAPPLCSNDNHNSILGNKQNRYIKTAHRMCQTLIFANMILNLSKSLSDALLFCTISFLPHELFSHLVFTSAIRIWSVVYRHQVDSKEWVQGQLITSFLHCLNQCSLLWDTFNVNLDISQGKPLEVHLATDHVRGIHKSLIPDRKDT